MDSTRAIIRLWRLCSPADVGPQVGGDGAISVEVLKAVLESELKGKLNALEGNSVDEILWSYMQPDTAGVVGFLQFWRGMEDILQRCGAHRSRLGSAQRHAIDGFRFLRTCVLEMVPNNSSQGRSVFSVKELRFFIKKTISVAGREGERFWQDQAARLPADELLVTGEEVASALLAWLEELVEEPDVYNGEKPQWPHGDAEADLDDSADEGNLESSRNSRPVVQERTAVSSAIGRPAGNNSLSQESLSSLSLPPPPAAPTGPPPRRSVLAGQQAPGPRGRGKAGGRGTGGYPGGGRSSGSSISSAAAEEPAESSSSRASALECGLEALLHRYERRPASPTKEMAAEWRDAMEFQLALRKRLNAARSQNEFFNFAAFDEFVRGHFSSLSARRRASKCASSRMNSIPVRGLTILQVVLHRLCRKRLVEGMSAWLTARRRDTRRKGDRERFDIFSQLLKAQCQTAVLLEHRAKIASRAGGLAFCLARLLRAALRGPWVHWCRLASEAPANNTPLASPPPMSSPGTGKGQGGAFRTPRNANARPTGALSSPTSPPAREVGAARLGSRSRLNPQSGERPQLVGGAAAASPSPSPSPALSTRSAVNRFSS